jgi:hypothetical protein
VKSDEKEGRLVVIRKSTGYDVSWILNCDNTKTSVYAPPVLDLTIERLGRA